MWKRHVLSTYIFVSLLFSQNLIAQVNTEPAPPPESPAYFVKIDPRGTYLFTNRNPYHPDPEVRKYLPKDIANPASSFDLNQLFYDPVFPLHVGDLLSFELVGGFQYGESSGDGYAPGLGAVFTDYANFIDAGPYTYAPDFYSSPTYWNGYPTDISQDFFIPNGKLVYAQVPQGAKQILFTANDSFFADNADPNGDFGIYIKIKIFRPYRLVKEVFINGQSQGATPINIAPSKEDGCKSKKGSAAIIKIRCLKKIPGSNFEEVAAGCKIKASHELGNFLGGHDAGHDQNTRPLGKFDPDNIEKEFIEIPVDGLNLKYFTSVVSGGYIVKFEGEDPDGNSIKLKNTVFKVATQTPFVRLTDIVGLRFHELNSHPGDMVWGTSEMRDKMSILVQNYFQTANDDPLIGGIGPVKWYPNPYDNPLISPIYSQGISLHFGGLFDVNKNWKPPHCGHRKGIDIDISLSTFNNGSQYLLKNILAIELSRRGFSTPVFKESPDYIFADHWHLKLK